MVNGVSMILKTRMMNGRSYSSNPHPDFFNVLDFKAHVRLDLVIFFLVILFYWVLDRIVIGLIFIFLYTEYFEVRSGISSIEKVFFMDL